MSKMLLRRLNDAAATSTAARSFAELLQRALERELGGDLSGIQETALRIADRLDNLETAMDTACENRERLRDRLDHHQRQRDESVEQLYSHVTRARKAFRGLMGIKTGDAYLGLHGETPRDPKALRRISRIIAGRMADEEWSEPPMAFGTKFKPQVAAKDMADRGRDLGESLDFLKKASPQVAVAKAAKKRAIAAFDDFHGKSARYLIAALELAGLDDLVAEVRNGVGRRGTAAEGENHRREGTRPAAVRLATEGVAGKRGSIAQGCGRII